ncbi:MAG: hypothetical protein F7C32_04310 [Desulfurococcales archaeon]|nr:hypothetical protein [Desulfurococcales archaeon]
MTKEPTQRPRICLQDVMEYDWDAIQAELLSSGGFRVLLLLGTYGESFILAAEAEPIGFGDCLEPQVFYLASCKETEPVDDRILSVASIADKIEYRKGCFYIIFNLRGTRELLRVYEMVTSKLGIKTERTIRGHWVVDDA